MVCVPVFLLIAQLGPTQTASAKPQNFNDTRQGGLIERTSTLPDRPAVTPELRGDIYMARKMYREAVDMYRLMPQDSAVSWNKTGIAYHQMLDLDSAKRSYEKSLKLNPRYPEAINNLGTVHYAKKSYRRAIQYYQRALKLSPDSASVLSNLGTALFARKKYEAALEAYHRALELDPDVFEHRNAAGVLLQERSVDERAKFHYYMAKTYAKSGQNERAILYLRKALEEGFKEREKLTQDPEFAAMQALPEFQEILKYQPKVL